MTIMMAAYVRGQRIGELEIIGRLGQGRTGCVYEAQDLLLLRRVAVKVVDDRALLRDEARALAAIDHSGVPVVHRLDDRHLVLERLVGTTLDGYGPLHGGDALAVLLQLAEILVAVDAAGVVHGDVRAGNVMRCADQRVVLFDFGGAPAAPDDLHGFATLARELLGEQSTGALDATLRAPSSMEQVIAELRATARWLSLVDGAALQREGRAHPHPDLATPVLIIEDDVDLIDDLRHVFGARGFATWSARNGRDAIDMVRRQGSRPRLILLDLTMPIMDGAEFLGAQAAEPLLAGVPVVVVSAAPGLARSLSNTVRAVVKKPFSVPSLIRSVQVACGESTATTSSCCEP